jgi:hypothetical protein
VWSPPEAATPVQTTRVRFNAAVAPLSSERIADLFLFSFAFFLSARRGTDADRVIILDQALMRHVRV